MSNQTFRPKAGSVIVNRDTLEVLGWWTERAPVIQGDTFRFHSLRSEDISFTTHYEPQDMELPVQTYYVSLVLGRIDRPGFQVWGTSATKPDHLHGSDWFRPVYDGPQADLVGALEVVLNDRIADILDTHQRGYLTDFVGYRKGGR